LSFAHLVGLPVIRISVLRKNPNWDQTAPLLRFLNHTQLDTHTNGRPLLNQWSVRGRGRYLHNTQHTQGTNIHALSGIRTPRS